MKRHDQEQMRILYNQWKESGESQTAFANRNGIRPTTFYYWTSKLGKAVSKPSNDRPIGFRPIAIEDVAFENHGPGATAVIHYPSGARLELHTPLEAHFLKTLVE